MNRQHARAKQLRDQIVMALRDADGGMLSTPDVAAKVLPWHEVEWWIPRHVCRGECTEINGYPVIKCNIGVTDRGDIRHTVKMPSTPAQVYPHLRVLEKAGRVAKLYGEPGDQRVYWAYIGDDGAHVASEINALNELFELESAAGGDA